MIEGALVSHFDILPPLLPHVSVQTSLKLVPAQETEVLVIFEDFPGNPDSKRI